MNRKVIIYTLTDPFTNNIRYIGKTVRSLNQRLSEHIKYSINKSTYKDCWIYNLDCKGIKPVIEELDIVDEKDWQFWEQYWISQVRNWNFSLTNSTNGGESNNSEAVRRAADKKGRKIEVYDINGSFLYLFSCPARVKEKLNLTHSSVQKSLSGRSWRAGKYLVRYQDDIDKRLVKDKSIHKNKRINKYKKLFLLNSNNEIIKSFNCSKQFAEYLCIPRNAIYTAINGRGFYKNYTFVCNDSFHVYCKINNK